MQRTNVVPFRRSGRSPRRQQRNITRRLLIVLALLSAATAVAVLAAPRWSIETISGVASSWSNWARVNVIDGDTIRDLATGRIVRLVGFNAPETYEPECEREAALGERAKARLRELTAGSDLSLTYVPCSCRPGTEGTNMCNYGRACGKLRADGKDVGTLLIGEGLAVSFICGATRCPPSPRPWC